ncbi:MAG: MBOAT family O-acyltransferase [Coriobacteriia bacterium]|nr:MBOAT family O-acyltransferase [Coriobacteriia bacterium]
MSFVSLRFAAFVAAALAVWWLTPRRFRTPVLAFASFAFYAWASPAYAVLLAALAAADWLVGIRMHVSSRPRRWLAWGVGGTVAVLAAFKYTGMAVATASAILEALGVGTAVAPSIVAPLGISFIAFASIHYLVSVYRGDAPPAGLIETAAYLSFFPTITMGPIKRYPDFVRALRAGGDPTGPDDVAYAAARVICGLAKKVVLADTLFVLTARLQTHGAGSAARILLAVYAYAFYIYFDFSGYSDMAIGIARLFGFRVMENFDWPYLRRNLAEFWGAWHISLTRFITEYVFIPLGGSRTGRWRTARNTLIAMAVSGLWHGASWGFVAWGLWHGAGLVVVRWWRELTGGLKSRHPAFARACAHPVARGLLATAGTVVTFNYVAMGWVLFAVPLREAPAIYSAMWRAIVALVTG